MSAPINGKMKFRVCAMCGSEFQPRSPTQQRCYECVKSKNHKCLACGAVYRNNATPANRHFCDPCLIAARSAAPKIKTRMTPERERGKPQTSRITKKWAEANVNSKMWYLASPDGETVVVRNLTGFIHSHLELFPNPEAAEGAFKELAHKLRNGSKCLKPCNGWMLLAPPQWANKNNTWHRNVGGESNDLPNDLPN